MLDFASYSLHIDPEAFMDLFAASGTAVRFERGDIRLILGMSGIELAYEVLDRSGYSYERTLPRHTINLSGEYWLGYALAHIQHKTCIGFDELIHRFNMADFISSYGKRRLELLDRLPLDISESEKLAVLKRFGAKAAKEAFIYMYDHYTDNADNADNPNNSDHTVNSDHSDTSDLSDAAYLADAADTIDAIEIPHSANSSYLTLSSSDQKGVGSFSLNHAAVLGRRLKSARIKSGLSQSELAKAAGIPVRTVQQYEQGQKDLSKARAEYLISLSLVLNCDPVSLLTD